MKFSSDDSQSFKIQNAVLPWKMHEVNMQSKCIYFIISKRKGKEDFEPRLYDFVVLVVVLV